MGKSTEDQPSDDVGTHMKPSCCPNPNAGLKCDLTTDVELEENDDESLPDLAVIHHLLALDREKQREK